MYGLWYSLKCWNMSTAERIERVIKAHIVGSVEEQDFCMKSTKPCTSGWGAGVPTPPPMLKRGGPAGCTRFLKISFKNLIFLICHIVLVFQYWCIAAGHCFLRFIFFSYIVYWELSAFWGILDLLSFDRCCIYNMAYSLLL